MASMENIVVPLPGSSMRERPYSVEFEVKNENDSDVIFQVQITDPLKFSVGPRSEGVLASQGVAALTLNVFPGAKYIAPSPINYFLSLESRVKSHVDDDAGTHDEKTSWTSKRIRIALVPEYKFHTIVAGDKEKPLQHFKFSSHEATAACSDIPLKFDKKACKLAALQQTSTFFELPGGGSKQRICDNVAGSTSSSYIDDKGEIDIERFLAADSKAFEELMFAKVKTGEAAKALFLKFNTNTQSSKLSDIIKQTAILAAKLGLDADKILSNVNRRLSVELQHRDKRAKRDEEEEEEERMTEFLQVFDIEKESAKLGQAIPSDVESKCMAAMYKLCSVRMCEATSDAICEMIKAIDECLKKFDSFPLLTYIWEHDGKKMEEETSCNLDEHCFEKLKGVLKDVCRRFRALNGARSFCHLKLDQSTQVCHEEILTYFGGQLRNQEDYFTSELVEPSRKISAALLFKLRSFFAWLKYKLVYLIEHEVPSEVYKGNVMVMRARGRSTPMDSDYYYPAHEKGMAVQEEDDAAAVRSVVKFLRQHLEDQHGFVRKYKRILVLCLGSTASIFRRRLSKLNKRIMLFMEEMMKDYCYDDVDEGEPWDKNCYWKYEEWEEELAKDILCYYDRTNEAYTYLAYLASCCGRISFSIEFLGITHGVAEIGGVEVG